MEHALSKVPFALDKSARNTLSEQMENALRQLIASGHYRPGETLPTIREWAKMLGVSMRVPEAVIPKLVKEGLIVARPRHGCVVAPRSASIFKGHVLLATPPSDHVYAANIMCGQIARRLEDAGYIVSRTSLRTKDSGKPDLARFNLSLRQSVDLAVLVYENAAVARAAANAKVPFVWFGDTPPPNGAIGHVISSYEQAIAEFAESCLNRGVRRIDFVVKDYSTFRPPAPLATAKGLELRTMSIPIDPLSPRPGSIALGAMKAFCRRLAQPGPVFPDLFLFTDDYLFQGALPVLMKHGVRIPEELRLATFSNRGNGPVAPIPFDRIENDPRQNGDTIAEAVLQHFQRGRFPKKIMINARYVRG